MSQEASSSASKRINRKTAQKYRLVYRSQEDPLINDPDAPTGVFVEVQKKPKQKRAYIGDEEELEQDVEEKEVLTGPSQIQTLQDLKQSISTQKIRDNEGEAALYGITFDDSNYDYMQHLREIGREDSTPAVFIPAPSKTSSTTDEGRRRGIRFREDLSAKAPDISSNLPSVVLPSEERVKKSYQDQQGIPDAISGLQPDMDPELREVLEALEDDAYVEDDEDIFQAIVNGKQVDEQDIFDDEDDDDDQEGGWEKQFSKFKNSSNQQPNYSSSADGFDEDEDLDDLASLASFTRKMNLSSGKKKSSGARTSTTGFSMSSSAMFRNEGLTLIDDRFDQIEQMYNDDDEEEEEEEYEDEGGEGAENLINSLAQDSRTSSNNELQSAAFEAIMDDFLENYNVVGKKLLRETPTTSGEKSLAVSSGLPGTSRGKINKWTGRGIDQLKEIKNELGQPQKEYLKRRYRIA
ncbi:Low temperature viability protein [Kockiozyma suomiensis]|uniref:Low temperature viability protein n=1 Tax=Kockiozyma suomiensis TaxID=1337062 RepID=UPI003343ADBC